MRNTAGERSSPFVNLLSSRFVTPLVIFGLLAAATIAWLATVATAERHRELHEKQLDSSYPLAALSKENTPAMYTQPFSPASVPLGQEYRPVYLYVSPTTAHYLTSAGGNYETLLAPWRSFFTRNKRPYIEMSRLDKIPRNSATVLILPSAVALSEEERRHLAAFQQAGGSILATWSSGARAEDGKWIGHAFLQDLFGVAVAGEVTPESDERFLNIFGDLPLTAGYPTGQRIWLENTSESALRLTGGKPAAYYMNWIRDAAPDNARAAIVFDEHGAQRNHARWAVIGFAETSWGTHADKLAGLLDNTLHWLSRGVAVTKATWPAPYRAAYIIEMDTEEGFGNAHAFATMMDAIGARATFYSLTSEAVRYPHLVRHLAKRHEIAFHGDVHDGFRGQPQELQNKRLDQMLADMASITEETRKFVGFRAPREEYDKTTERLLHAKGFLHHAADPNRTDARLPFFSEAGSNEPDKALVVLPRTQNDDISLQAGKQYDGAEQKLLHALLADLDNALDTGAMGLLSIHSQYFGTDSPLHAVMPDFLEQVAKRRAQVWTTSANEIADWWRERERLRYQVSGISDTFKLEVTIDGAQRLGRGAIIVTHRAANMPVSIHPLQPDMAKPLLKPLDEFRTALVFDGMGPGTYSYFVKPALLPSLQAPPDIDLLAAADRETVIEAVKDWAHAWSSKDINTYLNFYSADLVLPKGTSRAQWAKMRRERILPKQHIEVDILSPLVELNGNTAKVRFRQIYVSDNLKSDDRKTLLLQRENGKWRIRQETVGG